MTNPTLHPRYSNNYAVRPLPGIHCTMRPQNFWALVVLNVLSDAAIASIPVPVLWRLRVPLMRRIGVSLLLSSGLFVMSTAIVRAVLTLDGAPSIITINRWGFRETAVGMAAVNAPVVAPLFTRAFWARGPYRARAGPRVGAPPSRAGLFRGQRPTVFEIPSAPTGCSTYTVSGTGPTMNTQLGGDVMGSTGPGDEDLEKGKSVGLSGFTFPNRLESCLPGCQGEAVDVGEVMTDAARQTET